MIDLEPEAHLRSPPRPPRSSSTLRALRPDAFERARSPSSASTAPGGVSSRPERDGSGEAMPFADFDWCRRLAKLVANSTRQRIDEESPLLSASLPTGERTQIVLPPATSAGCVAITHPPALG